VAERAWRRARGVEEEGAQSESRLRVRTHDVIAMRRAVEPRLQEHTRLWRAGPVSSADGVDVVDYFVQMKKKSHTDELVALVRAAGSADVIDAELV
jgi:hypothetical protein